ncbi:putative Transcriptional regulator (putative DNA-binding phage protein) (plasmid) [Ralstonia solanacearum CMR15]|nr:putative Transcriptional regulator (putative DNA-binding phage protein) [Ralstonia solanacearum CMR15]
MPNFEKSLLRLKEQLGVSTDKDAADLLGMSDKALNARKRRDSFPTKEVFALAAQRPELGIDPDWIVTGSSNQLETAGNREASLLQCFRQLNDMDQLRLLQTALLWSGEMELALPRKPGDRA